jgi:hypothetical protein
MILATARTVLAEYDYRLECRAERDSQNKPADYYYALKGGAAHKLFPCSHINKWGEVRFRALVAGLKESEGAA